MHARLPRPSPSIPTDVTSSSDEIRPSRWKAVLSDIHFWVPIAALIAGLLVLRWVDRA